MKDLIIRTFKLPNKKIITTYKIFQKINDCFCNTDKYNKLFKFPPINEWCSCYWSYDKTRWNNIIIKENNIEYPVGFHSFTSLEDSKIIYEKLYNLPNYVLCKCNIKYRTSEILKNYDLGTDIIPANILVSRGLKIIKEIKNDNK